MPPFSSSPHRFISIPATDPSTPVSPPVSTAYIVFILHRTASRSPSPICRPHISFPRQQQEPIDSTLPPSSSHPATNSARVSDRLLFSGEQADPTTSSSFELLPRIGHCGGSTTESDPTSLYFLVAAAVVANCRNRISADLDATFVCLAPGDLCLDPGAPPPRLVFPPAMARLSTTAFKSFPPSMSRAPQPSILADQQAKPITIIAEILSWQIRRPAQHLHPAMASSSFSVKSNVKPPLTIDPQQPLSCSTTDPSRCTSTPTVLMFPSLHRSFRLGSTS